MKNYLLIVFFLFATNSAAGQALINAKAPDFSLSDQNGLQYSLAAFAGHPVVLLASDKKGEDQNHQWGELVGKKYGDRVKIVGVADVRTVPFFLKGKIKNDFKKDNNTILLDWDGVVFASYGFAQKVSNIALIDKNGIVRYLHSGGAERGAVEGLFRELDRLLK